MFVATRTRPDIAFSMSSLTRVAHRPGPQHLQQAKQLVSYLYSTRTFQMCFYREANLNLEGYNFLDTSHFMEGYVDSSHATCRATARSGAGHVFFLGKRQAAIGTIAKQLLEVGNSTTENEYIALSRASCGGFYIKQFIDELQLLHGELKFTMYEDSSATLNALKKMWRTLNLGIYALDGITYVT